MPIGFCHQCDRLYLLDPDDPSKQRCPRCTRPIEAITADDTARQLLIRKEAQAMQETARKARETNRLLKAENEALRVRVRRAQK